MARASARSIRSRASLASSADPSAAWSSKTRAKSPRRAAAIASFHPAADRRHGSSRASAAARAAAKQPHGGGRLPETQQHQAPVVLESERDLVVAQRPHRRRHRGVHRRPLGHLAERVGEEEAPLELQAHGHRRRGQGAGAGGVGQGGVGPAPLDVDAHAHREGVGQQRGVAGRLGLGHGPVGQHGRRLDPALAEMGQQGDAGGGRRPRPVAGGGRLVQQPLGLVAGGGRILRQPAPRLLDPVT